MRTDTLYVSDMDGTLLDNNSLVSPRSAEIISTLSHEGALITVATARTPATVDPLLANTFTRCPAIVMTGAALWDRQYRQIVDPVILPPGVAAEIVDKFNEVALDPFIYTIASPTHIDVYHGVDMTPGEEDFYQTRRHLQLKKFHIGSMPSGDGGMNRTILLFGIGDTGRVARLASMLEGRSDCSVSFYPDITSPSRSLIEIFGPGVSKANALTRLADKLGVKRTVVFGDNLNDLSMMAVADLAVAVDNAYPEVKSAADKVISSNSSDAVARFIREDE